MAGDRDRRPVDNKEEFAQPSLLTYDEEMGRRVDAEPSRRRSRKSKMEGPVLELVNQFGALTTEQVLRHFWTRHGKSAVYGYRLIQRLVGEAWLTRTAVFPDRGRSSPTALALTAAGLARIGVQKRPQVPSGASTALFYGLQKAESVLTLRYAGWQPVRESQRFQALRTWALGRYSGRLLTDPEILERSAIQRVREFPVSVPVYVMPKDGRIILQVGSVSLAGLRRQVNGVPLASLSRSWDLELVYPHPSVRGDYLEAVQAAARRAKVEFSVSSAPYFAAAPGEEPKEIAP